MRKTIFSITYLLNAKGMDATYGQQSVDAIIFSKSRRKCQFESGGLSIFIYFLTAHPRPQAGPRR
jgi:hypothetical protein